MRNRRLLPVLRGGEGYEPVLRRSTATRAAGLILYSTFLANPSEAVCVWREWGRASTATQPAICEGKEARSWRLTPRLPSSACGSGIDGEEKRDAGVREDGEKKMHGRRGRSALAQSWREGGGGGWHGAALVVLQQSKRDSSPRKKNRSREASGPLAFARNDGGFFMLPKNAKTEKFKNKEPRRKAAAT